MSAPRYVGYCEGKPAVAVPRLDAPLSRLSVVLPHGAKPGDLRTFRCPACDQEHSYRAIAHKFQWLKDPDDLALFRPPVTD